MEEKKKKSEQTWKARIHKQKQEKKLQQKVCWLMWSGDWLVEQESWIWGKKAGILEQAKEQQASTQSKEVICVFLFFYLFLFSYMLYVSSLIVVVLFEESAKNWIDHSWWSAVILLLTIWIGWRPVHRSDSPSKDWLIFIHEEETEQVVNEHFLFFNSTNKLHNALWAPLYIAISSFIHFLYLFSSPKMHPFTIWWWTICHSIIINTSY